MTTRQAAVITVSDRAAAGTSTDTSGPAVAELLREAGYVCGEPVVIPDGADSVEEALLRAAGSGARLVITTGGTGVAPRDETPEGTDRVITRHLPGIVEEIRRAAVLEKPGGMLSRGHAGIVGDALVVNVPGSRAAVASAVPIILSVAGHVIEQLDGGDH
ncbi:MogA/MoaB family molybdenum cofactor biosynthesis protein [Aeromicrobium sp.]|uniref:MogA/MoaB family molybdenum cofactor biosynthesis protein n=1 Tax=Aeromicrobium sp. TaxID=1871063 RepID=UPI002FC5DBB9